MSSTSTLHFLELSFQEDGDEMLPIAVAYVHAFNAKNGNVLGVDFPGWAPARNFQGSASLRVLGSAEVLASFVAQPKVSRLATLCGLSLKVAAVPAGAALAAVTRDNRGDRAKPSYARRIARRAAEQTGAPIEQVVARTTRPSEVSVSLTSASNKQNFLLKLKKRVVPASEQLQFNAYGLCIQGGIPQF